MVQVGISPELQERGYKTETQTSDLLGIAPSTLKAWRVSGKGPVITHLLASAKTSVKSVT